MKKFVKVCVKILYGVLALCVALGIAYVFAPQKVVLNKDSYVESTGTILNSDCGFYRPLFVNLTRQDDGGTAGTISVDVSIMHLRINLGDFSKANNQTADVEITQPALDLLDSTLQNLLQNNKNAIVRFAYDGFNGKADMEPSEQMMLFHAQQVCKVLNKYPNTITAIEAGFVGMWGEMHTSTLASTSTINKLVDVLLDCTDDIPVLVRKPQMIYDYLGISLQDLNNYEIDKTSKAYRLGVFNDGFLGSETDLGTYTDRETETLWLSKQTSHLPFGGEVVSTSKEMTNLSNCLAEMNLLNLSYLNYQWSNEITQKKWLNEYYTSDMGDEENYYDMPAQTYIKNHLGYRFVLKSAKVIYSKYNYNFSLNIKNIGFGNLNRTKQAQLILVSATKSDDVRTYNIANFNGEETYNFSLKLSLKGRYRAYVKFYNGTYNGSTTYNMALSNQSVFNSTLNANLIGTLSFD